MTPDPDRPAPESEPESSAEGDDPKYRSPRPRVVTRGWIVPDRPAPAPSPLAPFDRAAVERFVAVGEAIIPRLEATWPGGDADWWASKYWGDKQKNFIAAALAAIPAVRDLAAAHGRAVAEPVEAREKLRSVGIAVDPVAPAPSPLADRLADLQGSAEWIDARQLTPVIAHAERVEAQLAAARREADDLTEWNRNGWAMCERLANRLAGSRREANALMGLIVKEYRNGPYPRWRIKLRSIWPGEPGRPETYAPGDWDAEGEYWCYDRREDAMAAIREAVGGQAEGRPAGDAGGETPAVGAFIHAGRLGMNLDVGPEMIAFRRGLDRPGDAQAQFEAAVSRLVEHDRAGPTVAALHQAIQVAANLMAAWAEELEAGEDEAEIIDHMRCAAREARAVIGVPKSVIDAGSDSPDPAPAALRAQAEHYRAKWEDTLARLDAVTGTLALYGRRAEAGRDLARAVVAAWEAAGNVGATRRPIDPGDAEHLRRMALRLLARPIGERDGGETPGKAPESPQDAIAPPPAGLDGVEPSDRTTGLLGALAGPSSGPVAPRPCPWCGPGADTDLTREDGTDRLYRECLACGATGPRVATLDEAAADAAWDRRSPAIDGADLRKAAAARRAEVLLDCASVRALRTPGMPWLPDGPGAASVLGALIAAWDRQKPDAAPGIEAGAVRGGDEGGGA